MGTRLDEPSKVESASGELSVDVGSGRVITYTTYGDPSGDPVLLFHGTPGSGKLGALYDMLAREESVSIIAPDRPGYGNSSPWNEWHPRVIREAMEPVIEDREAESVDLLAFSGGAPFALALGATCPNRVRGISLVSAASPPSMGDQPPLPIRLVGHAAATLPGIAHAVYGLQHWMGQRRPDSLVDQLTTGERSVPPEVSRTVADAILEGIGEQTDGVVAESRLFVENWNIDFTEIDVPVEIYHGDNDDNASLSGVRALAEALPDATLHVVSGSDHLGTLRETRRTVLRNAGL
jgi:pimeloyl-ACP methyl ester carboxylesterase